jgi:hypothetical protein
VIQSGIPVETESAQAHNTIEHSKKLKKQSHHKRSLGEGDEELEAEESNSEEEGIPAWDPDANKTDSEEGEEDIPLSPCSRPPLLTTPELDALKEKNIIRWAQANHRVNAAKQQVNGDGSGLTAAVKKRSFLPPSREVGNAEKEPTSGTSTHSQTIQESTTQVELDLNLCQGLDTAHEKQLRDNVNITNRLKVIIAHVIRCCKAQAFGVN